MRHEAETPQGALLVRVHTLASNHHEGHLLCNHLLELAAQQGCSGGLVRPGIAGFGRHGLDSTLMLQEVRPEDVPMVVEVVGSERHTRGFLEAVQALRIQRLVTLQHTALG